ncbi:MAG: nucleoside triphosphate pyrophosphohydrolase [bacterium]|jgi:tetrapyrrole methylase family protein/MazG family protein
MAGTITVVGLGPGAPGEISVEVDNLLWESNNLYLRTERHPVAAYLKERGAIFASFDDIYDQSATFEAVYDTIAARLVALATAGEDVVYAVPGHPLVAEASVQTVMTAAAAAGITVSVRSGISFLDTLFTALSFDPAAGLKVIDALQMAVQKPDVTAANIITQVYSRAVAADVKLQLMEHYPDEYEVTVIRAAGVPGEEKKSVVPLYELDRIDWVDHLTSVFVPATASDSPSRHRTLAALIGVMERLRGEGGCPWDREQTHATLKPYLVEEAYEVVEAIDVGAMDKVCEELGDLLLQVVFHTQLAAERGDFVLADVIESIVEKMIRRHPHVFASTIVRGSGDVLHNWDKIKAQERGGAPRESALSGVPKHFPALLKAFKLQAKAAKVGFDWDSIEGAHAKVREESAELLEALSLGNRAKVEEEVGDLLFAVVNVARFAGIEPETALLRTAEKFVRRFRHIEAAAAASGRLLTEMTLAEMDALWEEAKGN